MNADLHSHSIASDGLLPARELVKRAALHGVDMLALTDHDDLSGLPEAGEAAREAGIRLIPGVEISTGWSDAPEAEAVNIHVVGLGIDPAHAELVAGLERVRRSRLERARRMGDSLARAGIPDAYEGALSYAGNPSLVSRTHFARFLVAHGYARDTGSVFERYLVRGRPGYVEHAWASLEEAVNWINAAGGVAVLAHPGRYPLKRKRMLRLLRDFREHGGAGVEVLSSSHTQEQWGEYAILAREYGLDASRGSDFHGPGESRVELGSLPELPTTVKPIWQRLQ